MAKVSKTFMILITMKAIIKTALAGELTIIHLIDLKKALRELENEFKHGGKK